MKGSPTATASQNGCGGRIRTFEYGIQSPAPYRLATPHRDPTRRSVKEADPRSGPSHQVQTSSVYEGAVWRQASDVLGRGSKTTCERAPAFTSYDAFMSICQLRTSSSLN